MKRLLNLVLVLLVSQCMVGCGKADTETAASHEPAAKAENSEQTANHQDAGAAAETTAQMPAEQANLPEAAPLKNLEWIKGGPVAIESGKVYVIEFWATWCGPCKVSIPHLTEIQHQYKDKGVTVVGISSEQAPTVTPFVKKMGSQMDYTVAVDTSGYMEKNYMQAFNIQGIPHAFIVDKAGKIAWQGHPMDDMDTVLEMVVAGTFSPQAYAQKKAEAAALQQQITMWFSEYFQTIEREGLTDEVKQAGENLLEKAPADALNALAWNILTRIPEDRRDLITAYNAAEKANQMTDGKDPSVLDTYALALFKSGKVQEAVDTQQKAVDLAADYPQAQAELKVRLKEYKAALDDKI